MISKTNSNWKDFVKDFGDAIGGVFVGYAIGKEQIAYGIFGVVLILTSIYIRFYSRKE